MIIELYIEDSKKIFTDKKELRKYLLSFNKIPEVKKLFVDDKSISLFGLCYFMVHENFPKGV